MNVTYLGFLYPGVGKVTNPTRIPPRDHPAPAGRFKQPKGSSILFRTLTPTLGIIQALVDASTSPREHLTLVSGALQTK